MNVGGSLEHLEASRIAIEVNVKAAGLIMMPPALSAS
jgi:hypothetical protein